MRCQAGESFIESNHCASSKLPWRLPPGAQEGREGRGSGTRYWLGSGHMACTGCGQSFRKHTHLQWDSGLAGLAVSAGSTHRARSEATCRPNSPTQSTARAAARQGCQAPCQSCTGGKQGRGGRARRGSRQAWWLRGLWPDGRLVRIDTLCGVQTCRAAVPAQQGSPVVVPAQQGRHPEAA